MAHSPGTERSFNYAAFVTDVRDQLAANTAAREAHIAALVARAPWADWSKSLGKVAG